MVAWRSLTMFTLDTQQQYNTSVMWDLIGWSSANQQWRRSTWQRNTAASDRLRSSAGNRSIFRICEGMRRSSGHRALYWLTGFQSMRQLAQESSLRGRQTPQTHRTTRHCQADWQTGHIEPYNTCNSHNTGLGSNWQLEVALVRL